MGKGTSELRQEVEETRARVGDGVEALSYKTDVGARLDDYVGEKKEAVSSSVAGAKDAVGSAVGSVGAAVPSRRSLQRMARENPLGVAVGAAAVGFVAGLLLPSTRMEDERLGEAADRMKDSATEAGQQALERGKDVAQSAVETVRQEGAEQGRELASDLRGRVPSGTQTEIQGGPEY